MKDKDKEKTKETPVETPKETSDVETPVIPTVEERLQTIQEELENVKDKYLRSLAEMENYKKRNAEELKRERKYAGQPIADKLIDSLEIFEQALSIQTDDPQFKNFLYGFKMIKDMIFNVLTDDGVQKIAINPGIQFDPNTMHAIETKNNPDEKDNVVLQVSKNGYMYKERLLRPAMVIINKLPETKIENEKIDINVA